MQMNRLGSCPSASESASDCTRNLSPSEPTPDWTGKPPIWPWLCRMEWGSGVATQRVPGLLEQLSVTEKPCCQSLHSRVGLQHRALSAVTTRAYSYMTQQV